MRWNKGWRAAALLLFTLFPLRPLLGQTTPPAAPSANQSPVPLQSAPPSRALFIMIDPAHGGSEPGAVLNAAIPEKDVTLSIARRLRQELAARGIPALLIRDGDATVSTDQRAQIVNSAHPALYIAVHATSQGSGMRIYTAMLPVAGENAGPFVDWQTAHAADGFGIKLLRRFRRLGFPCEVWSRLCIRSITSPFPLWRSRSHPPLAT